MYKRQLRKVSNYCINEALKEIDENDYIQILKTIIEKKNTCLLYTSDAADERSSVDLGGRRIIKKKKT